MRETVEKALEKVGFDEMVLTDTSELIIESYVFDQCKTNTCGNFGRNYGCPPHAGTEEERKARINKYKKAYIANVLISYKSETFMDSMKIFGDKIKALRKELKDEDVMVMGAGPCTKCEKCGALTEEPCRFPDSVEYSMEGSGIDIVSVTRKLKMTYNAGDGRIGFFLMVIFND